MKKLLFILCIGFTTTLFAQNAKFGINGGVNFANVNFEGSDGSVSISLDTDARTSFYVGGFAEISIPNMEHKFQTGLNLTLNGFRFSDSFDDDFESETEFRIMQINIPLLFKFSVLEGLYLNGGAYAGIIVDVEGEYSETFAGVSVTETENVSDEFNTIDFGLSVGAEYNLKSGLFFELRYNYGLVNIANPDEGDGDPVLNNRFFNIGIGYKF